MKLWILLLGMVGLAGAEPTGSRTWTATNGKTVEGKVLRVEGGVAVLKRDDGPEVKVPLTAFVEADRETLEAHFQIGASAGAEGSGAKAAEGLPHEAGKVVGPVEAADGASYHVYLPTTLKQGRKAPLLFYTHSGGGNPKLLEEIKKGAELCGWVMAISVESRNKESLEHNLRVSKDSVEHIVATLPVDEKRVYFTGNSGGGATAMANIMEHKTAGAMPNVAYIPGGGELPKGHYFVLGGGKDYNRYASAQIRAKAGKGGVHRMHPGGHGVCPSWQRVDGMVWLNARYLEANSRDHADEALDFEARVIEWIRELAEKEAHRAYSTARILKDEYEISSSNAAIVEGLIDELGKESHNVLYHEGLAVIDEISDDHLSKVSSGSKMKHEDPASKRAAEKELERFRGVPVIEGTLQAIASKTVGN